MVLSRVLVVVQLFTLSTALGVSGKLDFDNSHQSSLIRSADQRISTAPKYIKTVKVEEIKGADDFGQIGVVCTTDGCNTTNSNSDTIETDVVVHVQTKIPVKNDSKKIDDVPDVPVVVGYSGATLDSTIDDEASRPPISTPETIGIPANFDIFDAPFQNPSVGSLIDRRLEVQPSYPYPQNEQRVKTLPPITITMSEDARKIIENGIQLQVPYTRSYFGEEPPPQVVWYPNTRKQAHNPVEFKNVYKNGWRPSLWNARNIPHRHYGSNAVCQCNNRRVDSVGSELHWHFGQTGQGSFGNNYNPRGIGMKIDDKLAPPFHENR